MVVGSWFWYVAALGVLASTNIPKARESPRKLLATLLASLDQGRHRGQDVVLVVVGALP